MSRTPVLLVEDNPDLRDLMALALEQEFGPVVTASNGRIAIALLRAGLRPCAIVVDVLMPVVDGMELVSQLPELGLAGTPVLLTTGVPKLVQRIGVPVLAKPFDSEQLVRAVLQVVASASGSADAEASI